MWTDEDRAKAVAHERYLAGQCPRCGTRHEDWFDEDGSLRKEPVWEPVMRGCRGCEQREGLARHMPDDARRAGGYVSFVPAVEFDPAGEAARERDLGTPR